MRTRVLLVATAVAALLPVAAFAAIGATRADEVSAKLTGKAEAPAAGPKAGHGVVNIDLKGSAKKVCWEFADVGGIDKPLAAHIHKGKAKVAGPVVVPLGAAYKAKGCIAAAKPLIEAIEHNPGGYYVNVHTAKYPNGAIRGQLAAGAMTH